MADVFTDPACKVFILIVAIEFIVDLSNNVDGLLKVLIVLINEMPAVNHFSLRDAKWILNRF